MANLSPSRQKAILRKYARNLKFLMMVASIGLIVWTLPKQAKFRYEIEKGRIWTQKDLVSPYNFAILKTTQEVDNDRRSALESITPVYQLDENVITNQLDSFKNNLEIKWHASGINDKQKNEYLGIGNNLLQHIYEAGLLRLNTKFQKNAVDYPITY